MRFDDGQWRTMAADDLTLEQRGVLINAARDAEGRSEWFPE